MLTMPAPTPLNGDILADQLATAGFHTPVAVQGPTLELSALDENDRATVEPIVAAHPVTAQVEAERIAREQNNEATIRDRADTALATNAAFLNRANPTNAQVVEQVKALTRQNNGLIRLALRRFDATD